MTPISLSFRFPKSPIHHRLRLNDLIRTTQADIAFVDQVVGGDHSGGEVVASDMLWHIVIRVSKE